MAAPDLLWGHRGDKMCFWGDKNQKNCQKWLILAIFFWRGGQVGADPPTGGRTDAPMPPLNAAAESNRWFNGPPCVLEFHSTNMAIICSFYSNYSIRSIKQNLLLFLICRDLWAYSVPWFFNNVSNFTLFTFLITKLVRRISSYYTLLRSTNE